MEFLKKENLFQYFPQLKKEILELLIEAGFQYLTHRKPFVDSGELYEQALLHGCQLTNSEFKSARDGLIVLLDWLIKNNPENTGRFTFLNILSTHSGLDENTLTELDLLFSSKSKEYSQKKQMFSNLHLIDVDWRAGITIATDSATSLNTPYVKLQLSLANPQTGEVKTEVISLEYIEFKNLLRETRKMSSIMNTL